MVAVPHSAVVLETYFGAVKGTALVPAAEDAGVHAHVLERAYYELGCRKG